MPNRYQTQRYVTESRYTRDYLATGICLSSRTSKRTQLEVYLTQLDRTEGNSENTFAESDPPFPTHPPKNSNFSTKYSNSSFCFPFSYWRLQRQVHNSWAGCKYLRSSPLSKTSYNVSLIFYSTRHNCTHNFPPNTLQYKPCRVITDTTRRMSGISRDDFIQ